MGQSDAGGPGPLKAGETYAGFWIRFVAFVVDSIVVSLIITPIAALVIEKPGFADAISAVLASGDLLDMLIALAIQLQPANALDALLNIGLPAAGVILFWIYKSATPGKMATSTRIVDAATGAQPTKGQCVIRYLGYFVSIFGLGLGFLWVAFDKRKQGWHDKLAGTVVVRAPRDAVQR